MTFDPETTDPREVLNLTIESQHVTRGFSIGDYLLYVGKRAFNSFKTHGAGVNSIPPHVYRDLGRTLAKNDVIKTTKIGGSVSWESSDVRPVLQFLFDYLTGLDFTKLPEIERPMEYVIVQIHEGHSRTLSSFDVHTLKAAKELAAAYADNRPDRTYTVLKLSDI